MQEKKKRGSNAGSLIGTAFFILIFLARPIISFVRNTLGGSLSLPANLTDLIPIAVGAVVVVTIAVSAVRALGRSRQSDERLPTGSAPPRMPGAPLPPFGGPQMPGLPTTITPRMPSAPSSTPTPARRGQPSVPSTPRFEPIFNPRVLLFGIIGLVVLGGLALVVLGQSLP